MQENLDTRATTTSWGESRGRVYIHRLMRHKPGIIMAVAVERREEQILFGPNLCVVFIYNSKHLLVTSEIKLSNSLYNPFTSTSTD